MEEFLECCHRISVNDPSIEKIAFRISSDGELTMEVSFGDECPDLFEWGFNQEAASQSRVVILETAWEQNTTIRALDLDIRLLPYFSERRQQQQQQQQHHQQHIDVVPATSTRDTCATLTLRSKFFRGVFSNPSLRILHLRIPRDKGNPLLNKLNVSSNEWYECIKEFFEKLQHSIAFGTVAEAACEVQTTSSVLDEIHLNFPDRILTTRPSDTVDLSPISDLLSTCQVKKISINNPTIPELAALATQGIQHNTSITNIHLKSIQFDDQTRSNQIHSICHVLANHTTITTVEWNRCDWIDTDHAVFEKWFQLLCQRNLQSALKSTTATRVDISHDVQDGKIDSTSCPTSAARATAPSITFTNSPLQVIRMDCQRRRKMPERDMLALVTLVTLSMSTCHSLYLESIDLSSVSHLLVLLLEQVTPTLTHLYLMNNGLTSSDGAKLATALSNNSSCCLECLVLSQNAIIEDSLPAATAWKTYLETTITLKHWSYSFTNSTAGTIEALGVVWEGLQQNVSIETLSTQGQYVFNSRCGSGTICVQVLANVLHSPLQTRLNHLKLAKMRDLGINDSDWVSLARAISRNTSLRKLELLHVGIGNKTLQALGQSLKNNTTLHYVNFKGIEKITEVEWEEFARCVPHMHGLQVFKFSVLECFDRCHYAKQVASKLMTNSSLRIISYMEQLPSSERWYLELNESGRSIFMDRSPRSMSLWPRLLSRLNTKCHKWQKICSSIGKVTIGSTQGTNDAEPQNKAPSPIDRMYYLLRLNVDILATVGP